MKGQNSFHGNRAELFSWNKKKVTVDGKDCKGLKPPCPKNLPYPEGTT
jgi:hypothetical protein